MDSFGEYLSREREFRGVTLEEIAKTTNININYLRALENDNYDELPDEVFVKGFLRSFAECTGMNSNEVLLAYDEFITKKRADRRTSDLYPETNSIFKMKVSSIVAICTFIIISCFLVYYYIGQSKGVKSALISGEKTDQEKEEISNLKEEEPIAMKIVPQEEESSQPSVGITPEAQKNIIVDESIIFSPEETKKTPEIKVENPLILTIEATESVWVKLLIDNTTEKEALLKPGETARWKAEKKFIVTLGNKAGTHLKLNKIDLVLPETRTNVLKDYIITLDNIKSNELVLENSDLQVKDNNEVEKDTASPLNSQ